MKDNHNSLNRKTDEHRRSFRAKLLAGLALFAPFMAANDGPRTITTDFARGADRAAIAVANNAKQSMPVAASNFDASALGRLLAMKNGGDQLFRDPGCPPHIWGQSAECRRMVRKHKFIARGVGAARC